jgi:hypothetical protein
MPERNVVPAQSVVQTEKQASGEPLPFRQTFRVIRPMLEQILPWPSEIMSTLLS